MKKDVQRAVIMYGPPGAGKGTQAELLARSFDFIHFDTGRYLKHLYYESPLGKTDPEIKRERAIMESGKLNTPSFVLKIVSGEAKRVARAGFSIVFSGSPRTLFEAFGDKGHKGLLRVLGDEYGKKNIAVVQILVPRAATRKRNGARYVCKVCGLPRLGTIKSNHCSLCGGPLYRRRDDDPKVMETRLREYEERTLPIVKRMRKEGYAAVPIDGTARPFEVYGKIEKKLHLRA